MKVNQDLSILFWLCKQRKDDSGKAPIYARLTIDGIRTQFSLGKKVLPSQFMQQSGLVKGSSEDAKTLNNYLTLVKGKLQQHYNILITQHEIVTPEMVRNAFSGKTGNVKTLIQAFTWHNDQFEQKVKWYPWEKFQTLLNEKVLGYKMELELANLRDVLLAESK